MGDEVLVAHAPLLDYQLGVVQDESAHQDETEVEVGLEKHPGPEEKVGQREDNHRVEDRHEGTAEVQPFTPFREQGAQGERGEDQRRSHQGGYDYAGIYVDDVLEERPQADAG